MSEEFTLEPEIEKCKHVLSGKNKQYRSHDGPLDNFYSNAAVKSGFIEPVQWGWVMASKHLDALDKRIYGDEWKESRDEVEERLIDVVNYCLLIMRLMGEKNTRPDDGPGI